MASPLEGKLVRLRAREPEDEPLLFRWFNDPEVTENLVIRYPLTHAGERAFIESSSPVGFFNARFAVETLADARLIGGVDLTQATAEHRSASLGIAIGEKELWDRGYGTDTMRTACRFGFEEMNLRRIELTVYAPNERAQRVYGKVGFKVEGRLRDARFKSGRYQDVIVMGLLRDELVMD